MKKKYVSILLAGCLTVSMLAPAGVQASVPQPEVTQQADQTEEIQEPKIENETDTTTDTEESSAAEEDSVAGKITEEKETDSQIAAETEESEKTAVPQTASEEQIQTQTAVTGDRWIQSGKRWWYRHVDGSYTQNNWEKIKDVWYYFDGSGWMVTGWLKRPSGWYYLKASGAMATGWVHVGNSWYYMNENGTMQADTWIGNYYVDKSGAWIQGKTKVQAGWVQSGKRWWYRHEDGSYTKNDWEKIKGVWYYFDESGWMVMGWLKRQSGWYYLKENGAMATGWAHVGNAWYYLKASGAMATGWVHTGSGWYYLKVSGAMATGWVRVGSTWYYMNENGTMQADTWIGEYYVDENGAWIPDKTRVQTGWVQNSGHWMYMQEDGSYIRSTWKTIDGKEYYFDANGYRVTGWLHQGSSWYYLNSSGERVYDQWIGTPKTVGSCYISKYGTAVTGITYSLGDYIYTFDANGYCTKIENRYSYATDSKNGKTYKVEKQYDTDVNNLSENDFLAAVVYAEAANQELTGMTGVAMVILNRMASALYPSDARIVIYQASQFEVVRDGALIKAIAKLDSSEAAMKNAKEAVRRAKEIRAAYQKDGTVTAIDGLNVPEGHTIFEYLGFMTPAAFNSANLDPVKTAMFTYKNTAFYTTWIKKS